MAKSTLLLVLAAAMLFGTQALASPIDAAADAAAAPDRAAYIVVFKADADAGAQIQQIHRDIDRENAEMGASGNARAAIVHEYSVGEFRGFAGTLTGKMVRDLKANPAVALVEADQEVRASATQANPPSWGLRRISQRNLDLSAPYVYPDSAGSGATVYVIDTGIQVNHPDFGGRASWGYTACAGCPNTDDNGHGTHVAGTIAGATYGVAKKARVVAVKVLTGSGSGTTSGVIAGVNWVAAQARAAKRTVVANMSLGGGKSQALNDAVTAAYGAGVAFVAAAGNENADACNVSPASTPQAITVAATDRTDTRAGYSNFGSCVDVFAPGTGITSTWISSGVRTISGTSMASPHVAGAAALALGANPALTPAAITNAILGSSTPNKVKNLNNSPNRLVFVN